MQETPERRVATETEDALGRWLEEYCQIGRNLTETSANLFTAWKGWADAAGEFVGSQKRFSRELIARNFGIWREPGTGRRGFSGLALKEVVRLTPEEETY
jgi:putative DNA primase/helicase